MFITASQEGGDKPVLGATVAMEKISFPVMVQVRTHARTCQPFTAQRRANYVLFASMLPRADGSSC